MQRSMSRPAAVAMLAVAAAGVTACSGPQSPDLFLVKRTGTIPGARLTLRISDDGGAFCNGGPRKEITSAQLIEARAPSSTARRTRTSAWPSARSTSSRAASPP
jgi:hypothetical protein